MTIRVLLFLPFVAAREATLPVCDSSADLNDLDDLDWLSLVAQTTGDEELIYDLAWSPDGRRIATGSSALLRLYALDEEAGALVLLDTVANEEARFNSVQWLPSGGHLLAPSGSAIRLYEVDNDELVEVARAETDATELQRSAVAPEESRVVTCDTEGRLLLHALDLDPPTLTLLDTLEAHSRCTRVAMSGDGAWVLSAGHDGGVTLTSTAEDALVLSDRIQAPEESGEAIFASTTSTQPPSWGYAGTFGELNELWELEIDPDSGTLRSLAVHSEHASGLSAMEISHDGDFLLTGDHDHRLHLYARDAAGRLTHLVSQPFDGTGVHSARWSPDDRLVARTASNLDRLQVFAVGPVPPP